MARLMLATGIAMGSVFGSSEVQHDEDLLRGLAASRGVYEGPARRVSGPSEFDRIVQGLSLIHIYGNCEASRCEVRSTFETLEAPAWTSRRIPPLLLAVRV